MSTASIHLSAEMEQFHWRCLSASNQHMPHVVQVWKSCPLEFELQSHMLPELCCSIHLAMPCLLDVHPSFSVAQSTRVHAAQHFTYHPPSYCRIPWGDKNSSGCYSRLWWPHCLGHTLCVYQVKVLKKMAMNHLSTGMWLSQNLKMGTTCHPRCTRNLGAASTAAN